MIYLFWLGICVLVGKFGQTRKIGFWWALIFSILLSPLIGFIIVLFSNKKDVDQENSKCDVDWMSTDFHGQGILTFPDGRNYVGEFANGMLHGQGTLTFPNGSKYVGEFVNDMYHDQGTFNTADGNERVGEVANATFHGCGTRTYLCGGKYVGEFANNKRHGQGAFTYLNGKKFAGEWDNGDPKVGWEEVERLAS